MKQKGQVFSLDLLVSIVLVIAALGLAMQFFELKAYEAKEYTKQMELERVGNTAAELLVSNPDIVCELTDESGLTTLGYLNNCIPKINANPYRITKAKMGIPAAYNCKIDKDTTAGNFQTDCSKATLPGTAKNIFSVKRTIVFYDKGSGPPAQRKQLKKSELYTCVNNDPACKFDTCGTSHACEITLWVWKT